MNRYWKILAGLGVLVIILLFVGGWMLSVRGGPAAGTEGGGPLGTFFSVFNGGGSPGESPTASTPTATIQTENGETVTIPRLRQIYNKPVAGATFLVKNISTTTLDNQVLKRVNLPATFIRFTDRATGHIYETKPDSLNTEKISNTTVAKIYEAYFTNGGNSVIYRYLNNAETRIETYYAALIEPTFSTSTPPTAGQAASSTSTTATTTSRVTPLSLATSSTKYQLVGRLLPEDLNNLAVSPGKDRIFYLQDATIGAKGSIAPTNNNQPRQIFTYPLREWLINWENPNTIVLTTKPSGGVAGYLFFLNASSGGLTKVFGNVAGLTALSSPDLSFILFSSNNGSTFNLNLYNAKTGGNSGLSLVTLPEKCVWSRLNSSVIYCAVPLVIPKGSYPDVWYQGDISFNDNIWKINVKTGEQVLIAKPNELSRAPIDAVNLSLDANENYLMFINKKDLTLWNFLINPPTPPAAITATSTPSVNNTNEATTSNSVRSTILR